MLCIQIAKNGRTKEPESAPREMSQVFPKIFDALHKNGISRARVATELSLPQSELEALMFGLALAGIEGGGKVRAAGELLFRP